MSEFSRLRWLCRRGMKELDVVLSNYLETSFTAAAQDEQQTFRELLEVQDPDLYSLLVGRTASPDQATQDLVNKLKTQLARKQ